MSFVAFSINSPSVQSVGPREIRAAYAVTFKPTKNG
jgi:hypothetical protein